MMKILERNHIVNAGFALALAILAAIASLSYKNMTSMIMSGKWEAHLQVEIRELGELLLVLKDVESMYRGFIITGNEQYLEAYNYDLGLIDLKMRRLRTLTRDAPPQQKRLESLEPLIRDKIAMVKEAVDLRRTEGSQAAGRSVMTGRGKRLMDEIRSLVAEAQDYDGRLLRERQAEEEAHTRRVVQLFIAGAILSLALLCTVFILLKSEIAWRTRVEEELQKHRDHLDKLVQERTIQLEKSKIAAEAATLAKSEFLENMSHEMRTPLTGIMGVIDLLLMDSVVDGHRHYLEMAKTSADSLTQLIDDILDFAKTATGEISFKMQPFDLHKCVRSATDVFELEANRKGLRFLVEIDESAPEMVVSDEGRLRQVLVNLTGNAVKFTERGAIEVTVRPAPDPARPERNAILFAVRDTGIGISADHLKTIFEKFTPVDVSSTKRFGGVGLGLAFSRQIIEKLGGKMWAESRHGEGSIFSFTLPITGESSTAGRKAEDKLNKPLTRITSV